MLDVIGMQQRDAIQVLQRRDRAVDAEGEPAIPRADLHQRKPLADDLDHTRGELFAGKLGTALRHRAAL
jgi:hypothetical protein